MVVSMRVPDPFSGSISTLSFSELFICCANAGDKQAAAAAATQVVIRREIFILGLLGLIFY